MPPESKSDVWIKEKWQTQHAAWACLPLLEVCSTTWPQRNPTFWHMNRLTAPIRSHAANSRFQHLAPYLVGWAWLMLSASASAPELEAGLHSGRGAPSSYNCSTVFVPPTAASAQARLMRWIWPRTRACWHHSTESVFGMGLRESWDGERERHICPTLSAEFSMVLCSLWPSRKPNTHGTRLALCL